MGNYYVIYRDIEGEETFEKMEPPEFGSRIREQIIPSRSGSRPIHIRWYHRQFGPNALHLVAYAHDDLAVLQARSLALRAAQFAWGEPGSDLPKPDLTEPL